MAYTLYYYGVSISKSRQKFSTGEQYLHWQSVVTNMPATVNISLLALASLGVAAQIGFVYNPVTLPKVPKVSTTVIAIEGIFILTFY